MLFTVNLYSRSHRVCTDMDRGLRKNGKDRDRRSFVYASPINRLQHRRETSIISNDIYRSEPQTLSVKSQLITGGTRDIHNLPVFSVHVIINCFSHQHRHHRTQSFALPIEVVFGNLYEFLLICALM